MTQLAPSPRFSGVSCAGLQEPPDREKPPSHLWTARLRCFHGAEMSSLHFHPLSLLNQLVPWVASSTLVKSLLREADYTGCHFGAV